MRVFLKTITLNIFSMNKFSALVLSCFAIGALFFVSTNTAQAAYVCATDTSLVGKGYVVIGKRTTTPGTCPSSLQYEVVIPNTSGGITRACQVPSYLIPSNFVTLSLKADTLNDCPLNYYNEIRVVTKYDTYLPVCDGSYVPTGWIITTIDPSTLITCGASSQSSWIIQKATAASYSGVCDRSAVPNGYVITSRGRGYANCDAGGTSIGAGFNITSSLSEGMWVCDGSPIPGGYVITEYNSRSGCEPTGAIGSGPAYRISSNLFDGMVICSGSFGAAVTKGYVVTEINNYLQCAPSTSSGPGYKVSLAKAGWVCTPGELPSNLWLPGGFVITGIDNIASCGVGIASGPAYQLDLYATSSRRTICAPSPIPADAGIVAEGMYAACAASGTGPGYIIEPIRAGSLVCPSSPIPIGMVITAVRSATACGGVGEGFIVDYPSSVEGVLTDVCYPSSTPAGFVIKSRVGPYSCGSHQGWTISRPSSVVETFICGDSPIPNPFLVTRSVSTTQCGSLVLTGFYISLLGGDGPYNICDSTDPSSLPAGYVITSRRGSGFTQCGGSGSGYVVEKANAGKTVCEGSPIPLGYVIIGIRSNYSACTVLPRWNGRAYDIQRPNVAGGTTICLVSGFDTIPVGYVVISIGNALQCDGISSANIRPEGEIGSGGPEVVPSEFIGTEPNVLPGGVPAVTYDCSHGVIAGGFIVSAAANAASCP